MPASWRPDPASRTVAVSQANALLSLRGAATRYRVRLSIATAVAWLATAGVCTEMPPISVPALMPAYPTAMVVGEPLRGREADLPRRSQ